MISDAKGPRPTPETPSNGKEPLPPAASSHAAPDGRRLSGRSLLAFYAANSPTKEPGTIAPLQSGMSFAESLKGEIAPPNPAPNRSMSQDLLRKSQLVSGKDGKQNLTIFLSRESNSDLTSDPQSGPNAQSGSKTQTAGETDRKTESHFMGQSRDKPIGDKGQPPPEPSAQGGAEKKKGRSVGFAAEENETKMFDFSAPAAKRVERASGMAKTEALRRAIGRVFRDEVADNIFERRMGRHRGAGAGPGTPSKTLASLAALQLLPKGKRRPPGEGSDDDEGGSSSIDDDDEDEEDGFEEDVAEGDEDYKSGAKSRPVSRKKPDVKTQALVRAFASFKPPAKYERPETEAASSVPSGRRGVTLGTHTALTTPVNAKAPVVAKGFLGRARLPAAPKPPDLSNKALTAFKGPAPGLGSGPRQTVKAVPKMPFAGPRLALRQGPGPGNGQGLLAAHGLLKGRPSLRSLQRPQALVKAPAITTAGDRRLVNATRSAFSLKGVAPFATKRGGRPTMPGTGLGTKALMGPRVVSIGKPTVPAISGISKIPNFSKILKFPKVPEIAKIGNLPLLKKPGAGRQGAGTMLGGLAPRKKLPQNLQTKIAQPSPSPAFATKAAPLRGLRRRRQAAALAAPQVPPKGLGRNLLAGPARATAPLKSSARSSVAGAAALDEKTALLTPLAKRIAAARGGEKGLSNAAEQGSLQLPWVKRMKKKFMPDDYDDFQSFVPSKVLFGVPKRSALRVGADPDQPLVVSRFTVQV